VVEITGLKTQLGPRHLHRMHDVLFFSPFRGGGGFLSISPVIGGGGVFHRAIFVLGVNAWEVANLQHAPALICAVSEAAG
jgi:hypothetical protein